MMYINPSPSVEEIEWLRHLPRSKHARPGTHEAYALAIELRQVGQLTLDEVGEYIGISQQAAAYRIRKGEAIIEKMRNGQ